MDEAAAAAGVVADVALGPVEVGPFRVSGEVAPAGGLSDGVEEGGHGLGRGIPVPQTREVPGSTLPVIGNGVSFSGGSGPECGKGSVFWAPATRNGEAGRQKY